MSQKFNHKISVTGLGYVGLPVAVAFGRHAQVIGFDRPVTITDDLDPVNHLTLGNEMNYDVQDDVP